MGLWTPARSRYAFAVDNFGANPSLTPGTSVIPGVSNAEGSFTQILSALAEEISGFYIRVSDGGLSTVAKNHLLDIGIDPAGGTSYSAIVSNIVCGESVVATVSGSPAGHCFLFPLRVPDGASVAARVQGSHTTAGAIRIGIRAYGRAASGLFLPVGQYAETIGTITNSNGVSFTPGNAADGTWVSLGTTVRDLWWWQLCYQVDNGTITNETTYVDLGYGDVTTKHTIIRLQHVGGTGELIQSAILSNLDPFQCFCPLAAGTEMFVRGRCVNAPDTGYNAVAVGIGG